MQLGGVLYRGAEIVGGWVKWLVGRKVDVAAEAERRLRCRPWLALDEVFCAYRGGVLLLHGTVTSRSLRRLAEALVYRVDGVVLVENHIEVVPPPVPARKVHR